MANYTANCKISGPRNIGVNADVDFNGLQWSYKYGLIFPNHAAATTVPVLLPDVADRLYSPRTT